MKNSIGESFLDRIDTCFSGDASAREERILSSDPETMAVSQWKTWIRPMGLNNNLGDGGWLLIRFSGTEPIIRVYTETTDKSRLQAILDDGLSIAGLK